MILFLSHMSAHVTGGLALIDSTLLSTLTGPLLQTYCMAQCTFGRNSFRPNYFLDIQGSVQKIFLIYKFPSKKNLLSINFRPKSKHYIYELRPIFVSYLYRCNSGDTNFKSFDWTGNFLRQRLILDKSAMASSMAMSDFTYRYSLTPLILVIFELSLPQNQKI